MRTTARVLALLVVAACASAPADPNKPKIALDIFEARYAGRSVAILGNHAYRVVITNGSQVPVIVDSIRIDPGFGGGLEIMDGSQRFNDVVAAGSSETFDMMVTIQPSRDRSLEANYRLDTLRVDVGFHIESGSNYFESCSCPIRYATE